MTAPALTRAAAVRHGTWLTWATIAYNCLEAVLAIGAGIVAGSIALVGFGLDSVVEVRAAWPGYGACVRMPRQPIARARSSWPCA